MAKAKTIYVCGACGYQNPQWLGRCPDCGGWNTISEEKLLQERRRGLQVIGRQDAPEPISTVDVTMGDRIETGIGEFDRALGGGMVRGSTVLVGGDPGIGKSTLLLQSLGRFSLTGNKVLYVSGEESMHQIRMRGERLGIINDNLLVWAETSVEAIMERMKAIKPDAVVIDSIQTLYTETLESSCGSVSQVREVSYMLINTARALNIPLFLIGHVTKDGSIAGPRVLEHMVDTVVYFEGSSSHIYRILRAVKNRYGSVMEIGVFEMKEAGLKEVKNPSEIFLEERPIGVSGSSVGVSLEGTRVLLVEIQALVTPSLFGTARRTVTGVDYNKVIILSAVIEKKAHITLANHDIFVKVVGGIKIDEPSIDLAIVAAIISNSLDKPIDSQTIVFGEVGLAGEVRAVTHGESRVKEAEKLGFKRVVMPKNNLKGLKPSKNIKYTGVDTIKEALDVIFT